MTDFAAAVVEAFTGRLLTDFAAAVRARLGADRLRSHVPLAPFTTFRVGGPAEWLIETRGS